MRRDRYVREFDFWATRLLVVDFRCHSFWFNTDGWFENRWRRWGIREREDQQKTWLNWEPLLLNKPTNTNHVSIIHDDQNHPRLRFREGKSIQQCVSSKSTFAWNTRRFALFSNAICSLADAIFRSRILRWALHPWRRRRRIWSWLLSFSLLVHCRLWSSASSSTERASSFRCGVTKEIMMFFLRHLIVWCAWEMRIISRKKKREEKEERFLPYLMESSRDSWTVKIAKKSNEPRNSVVVVVSSLRMMLVVRTSRQSLLVLSLSISASSCATTMLTLTMWQSICVLSTIALYCHRQHHHRRRRRRRQRQCWWWCTCVHVVLCSERVTHSRDFFASSTCYSYMTMMARAHTHTHTHNEDDLPISATQAITSHTHTRAIGEGKNQNIDLSFRIVGHRWCVSLSYLICFVVGQRIREWPSRWW